MMMTQAHERTNTRTCVGCRTTDERDELLRVVLGGDPPTFVVDVRRRAAGRGVSVHPRRDCIAAAVKTNALVRGLRGGSGASAEELCEAALGQYARRAQGLLLAAFRSHNAALGEKAVREAMDERRVSLLVVARDAEGRREELEHAAARSGRGSMLFGTKESLGKLFGRELLGVVAILDAGIAGELRSIARCTDELANPPGGARPSAVEES